MTFFQTLLRLASRVLVSRELLRLAVTMFAFTAIALLLLGWVIGRYELGTKADQYALARDLIVALIGLASVLGLIGWYMLRHVLREDVRDTMRGEFSKIQATVFLNLGLQYYQVGDLERAIADTRRSLAQTAIADDDRLAAKNNLAYFLAAKERQARQEGRWALTPSEAEEAKGFAFEIRGQYRRSTVPPYGNVEILETFAFVRATFADGDEELGEVRREIELLMNTDGTEAIRQQLENTLRYLEDRTS